MYRNPKKMLMSLSIGSLLFIYTVYLSQLFQLGDAYMGWLLVGVLMSSALLFGSTHPKNWMSRRSVMNTLLVVNSFVLGYGTLLATDMERSYSTILSIIGYLLVACMLISIYRTSLITELATRVKVLHSLNITTGIALTFGTLYFLYLFFLFSEDGNGAIWKLLVPLVLYGFAYIIQMKTLSAQRKEIAYAVAAIQVLMPAVLVWLWTVVNAGEGGL